MPAQPNLEVDGSLREDAILSRYLDFAKFVNLLHSRTLYLCRGDLFQDRYEGSFTPSIRAAIENAYKDNKIDFTYEKFKKELREGVYVNCWTLGADDNMALWLLYGKSPTSVAVTTTVAHMKQASCSWWGPSGRVHLRKVEYIEHRLDPKINIVPYSQIFSYKQSAYTFEKEVRIILDRFDETFKLSKKEDRILFPIDPSQFIQSIVVSPQASKSFLELVKDVTGKYGVTSPVKFSKLEDEPI